MDDQLVFFQLADALLVGPNDAGDRCVENTLQQLGNLFLDLGCLRRQCLGLAFRQCEAARPEVLEHRGGDSEQAGGRLDRVQQLLELALDGIAADGLAVAGAAALRTEIIGVAAMAALRPAGGERCVAMSTHHVTAQRKIFIEVRAPGRDDDAVDAVLHALPDVGADERLMLTLTHRHVPGGRVHEAGIDGLAQQDSHPLIGNPPARPAREEGMILQEAADIGLVLETPRRIAFERFGDDGSDRFVALQHSAASVHADVFIAHGGLEHPIAVHDAGAHAVFGLLAVLLPLVLRDARQQVLDEKRVRVLAELDGGGFELPARVGDHTAQFEMGL